jgi:hypothetical protein
MALSGISDIGWYIQQLSGFIGQSGLGGTAGVSGLSGGSGGYPAGGASAGAVGASAIGASDAAAAGQNLQLFMQALYQALSDAETPPSTNAGGAEGPDLRTTASPTYSKGQSPSARSTLYQQGQPGLHSRIESLINVLRQGSGPGNVSSAAGSAGNLSGLQAAFSRLLQNLGIPSRGAAANSSRSQSNTLGGLSSQGSDLTLHSWLRGLQQSLQQPGTTRFSSRGNIIDVVV